jgi:uncharacterized protein involved in outer membrane biogenesis
MSTRKKTLLAVILVIVALLVALAIIVPMFVDLDRYRPQVIAYIEKQTGKPVAIQHLQLTLFPALSVRADACAFGNPPGFPPGDFVTAKRIYAEVEAGALWRRQVVIKSLELDQPVITLLSDGRGRWNFQNHADPRPLGQAAFEPPESFTLGIISRVKIEAAHIAVASLQPSGAAGPVLFEARGVASTLYQVDLRAFTSASPGAARDPLLAAQGEALVGLAIPEFGPSKSSRPAAEGDLKADDLRFGSIEATDVKSKLRIFSGQVFLDDLGFDVYDGHATGDVSFNLGGPRLAFRASTRLSGVDVAKLLAAFPGGSGKMTGTMEGSFDASGEVLRSSAPIADMQGTGQLTIRNGRLPTLHLNENLIQLARVGQLGPGASDPTAFSLFSADLNLADQRIVSRKITIAGNGIDIDGSGALNLVDADSLDYQGTAKLAAPQNLLTQVIAGLSGATYAHGKLTFSFALAGTVQNPRFRLKSKGGWLNPGGREAPSKAPVRSSPMQPTSFKLWRTPQEKEEGTAVSRNT